MAHLPVSCSWLLNMGIAASEFCCLPNIFRKWLIYMVRLREENSLLSLGKMSLA